MNIIINHSIFYMNIYFLSKSEISIFFDVLLGVSDFIVDTCLSPYFNVKLFV